MKYEFDFSDIDRVMDAVHADCPEGGDRSNGDRSNGDRSDRDQPVCLHFDEEMIKTLNASDFIDHSLRMFVEIGIMIRNSGAPPKEGIEHLRSAFGHAFFCGALYARHKLLSMELEKLMEVKSK